MIEDLKENKRILVKNKTKEKEVTSRDTSGVTTLVSNVVEIDSIPKYRSKSHRIKISDSTGKNTVSAVRYHAR